MVGTEYRIIKRRSRILTLFLKIQKQSPHLNEFIKQFLVTNKQTTDSYPIFFLFKKKTQILSFFLI